MVGQRTLVSHIGAAWHILALFWRLSPICRGGLVWWTFYLLFAFFFAPNLVTIGARFVYIICLGAIHEMPISGKTQKRLIADPVVDTLYSVDVNQVRAPGKEASDIDGCK